MRWNDEYGQSLTRVTYQCFTGLKWKSSNRSWRSARLTVKKKLRLETKLRRYLVMDAAYQAVEGDGFRCAQPILREPRASCRTSWRRNVPTPVMTRLSSAQIGGMGSVCQLALPVKRALNGSAGAGLAGFCRAPPRACMVDRLAPFNKSTWPFPRRSEVPVAGLTRAVLNRGSVCGLGSGSSVVSACSGGTATGSVLSLSGAAGSIDRASCLTFAGQ